MRSRFPNSYWPGKRRGTNTIDAEYERRTGQKVRRLKGNGLLALLTLILAIAEHGGKFAEFLNGTISTRATGLFEEYVRKLEDDPRAAKAVLPLLAEELAGKDLNGDILLEELNRIHDEAKKQPQDVDDPCDPSAGGGEGG